MRYPPLMQSAPRLPLLALPFGLALACLSCSSDPTPASTGGTSGGAPVAVMKTVGPEGEVIEVEGAKVTIPKGALASSVAITITASSDPAPAGFVALSRIFKCEPSGTDFAEPVTMQMPFTDDGKPKTMFWTSGGNPSFNDVGGTAVGSTMTATVRHFSAGFVGRKE
jgi:hypothetical protein